MIKNAKFNTNIGKLHEAITVAYHEAGHVLIALLFYSKISSAFLQNINDDIGGITEFDLFLDFEDNNKPFLYKYLINSYICINYAGMLAEKINLKKISGADIFPKAFKYGCYEDLKEISNIIKKYNLAPPGRERAIFKNKMIKTTTALLNHYWDDVVLIAHALCKSKITHNDVKKILQKSPNKAFWKAQFKKINYLHKNNDLIDFDKKFLAIKH